MTPDILLTSIIRPALALLGPRYQGKDAERMLIAIALQESGLTHRVQVGGPARGFWQFEQGGGVNGVLNHPSTAAAAKTLCATLCYPATREAVYSALADNDILAASFARLLLWSDPKPLPVTEAEGWACYQRNWRPGRPHPDRWPANWAKANEVIS